MMLCERDESVQRESAQEHEKCCFSAILKRGSKGPSFQDSEELSEKLRGWLRVEVITE
jgi:hypothetical protein